MTIHWYALHVITGSEPEVCRQLQTKGFTALVPIEVRSIRSGGQWQQREYRLFAGYVFVLMNYRPETHHILRSIPGVIRVLPKDRPMPLSAREVAWVVEMGAHKLTPSTVDFSCQPPRVVDGPLLELEDKIIKFNRHRRRALVELTVLGETKQIELSIEPV